MKNVIKYILIVCYIAISVPVFAQHSVETVTDSAKQVEWIEQTLQNMLEYKPGDAPVLEPIIHESGDFYAISYKLKSSGVIKLGNNSCVYMVSNSSHDNPEIGDVTIAIDCKNNVFIHKGHICGGLIRFECNKKIPLKTAADFFNNFTDDTEGSYWIEYRPRVPIKK